MTDDLCFLCEPDKSVWRLWNISLKGWTFSTSWGGVTYQTSSSVTNSMSHTIMRRYYHNARSEDGQAQA